jgi:adenylate cyclase
MTETLKHVRVSIGLAEILKANVLIVDDLESSILLLERLLRGAGYESIESTTNPREVCALHKKNNYAIILLDLKMPEMDGFQVMEGLLELEPSGELPVLVVTTEPGHKLRALHAGARDFVSKPLDLPEVLIRVHNIIEVRLLRREALRLYDELDRAQAS